MDADNEYALQTASDVVGGRLLNGAVSRAASANEQIKFGNRILGKDSMLSPANQASTREILNLLGKDVAGINYDRLKVPTDIVKDTKSLYDLNEKLKKLEELERDCPELKDQIDDLKKLLDQEIDRQDPSETTVDTRNSFDPNALYGPVGIDTPGFIADLKRQPFLIHFENSDTAGADAACTVFRNPTTGRAFVRLSLKHEDLVHIRLHSLTGLEVANLLRGRQAASATLEIDLSCVPPGVYMIVPNTGSRIRDVAKLTLIK